jgi:large subunit ribosomal protein L9
VQICARNKSYPQPASERPVLFAIDDCQSPAAEQALISPVYQHDCAEKENETYMEILLKQNIENLGNAGDIVKVKAGYARNFLIPRGLAMPATAGLRKQSNQLKDAAERRRLRELATARDLADRISATPLTFTARAGESGRLYGSITSAQIADALAEALDIEIDRRRIRLEHSLRELGEHDVTIHLAQDVDATFKVVIEAEGELEKDMLSKEELETAAEEQGVVVEEEEVEEVRETEEQVEA